MTVDSLWISLLTGLPRGAPRPPPARRIPLEAGFLRATLGPAALIVCTPLIVVWLWVAIEHHEGSLWSALVAGPAAWAAEAPLPSLRAVALILGWVVVQAVLLAVLPGKRFLGPVTPTGAQPVYRLNGLFAWVVTHGLLFGLLWPLGWLHADGWYRMFGEVLITLNLGALALCGLLYVKGRLVPSSTDAVTTGNFLFDFFQGIELHPSFLGLNLKQLVNSRISMMGWSVIAWMSLAAQLEREGSVSWGMLASTALLVGYLFKFFVWEGGYFHSLDVMHDRFGYYIAWGVLVWVPAVYAAPFTWQVDHPSALPAWAAVVVVAAGALAIAVNYQADEQRQRVRATGGATTIWGRPPELVRAQYRTTDGETRESLLLVSGWWGVARHFHYVPELAAALFWTLPAGVTHFAPWIYVVFLAILLTDRARRDEKRCAAKYGETWTAYCARVRWRMLPGLY